MQEVWWELVKFKLGDNNEQIETSKFMLHSYRAYKLV